MFNTTAPVKYTVGQPNVILCNIVELIEALVEECDLTDLHSARLLTARGKKTPIMVLGEATDDYYDIAVPFIDADHNIQFIYLDAISEYHLTTK